MSKIPDADSKNPFRLPENYFEQFSEDLQIRLSEEKLKEKFGKKNPFYIPENYFESLNYKFENLKQLRKINIFSIFIKTSVSIAAGFILFFALRTFIFNNHDSSKNTASQSISADSLKQNIVESDFYEDIDENTIVSFITEPENITDTVSVRNSDEETLNYLTDNTDDVELIADL